MFRVRPFVPDDRGFMLGLAPRLTIGMPPWRDSQLWLTAVQGWIIASIDQYGQTTMICVAEDDHAERIGFVTVAHQTHFTGERQASIGELATTESAERRVRGW